MEHCLSKAIVYIGAQEFTMKSSEIHFGNDWQPFRISLHKPDLIRPMGKVGGIEDRLRVVAFAELQARDAFAWGSANFPEAPEAWRLIWQEFSVVEDRHAQMLLDRMDFLGFDPGARTVSDKLTRLCRKAPDAVSFLFFLSSAEERGMEAGTILGKQMQPFDAESAAIFAQIAAEEVDHVRMAKEALAGAPIEALKEKARSLSATL